MLRSSVVAVIAIVDYLRPDSERSHIGRFVNSVLTGDAGLILQRKIDANWSLLTTNVLTLMVPLGDRLLDLPATTT